MLELLEIINVEHYFTDAVETIIVEKKKETCNRLKYETSHKIISICYLRNKVAIIILLSEYQ